MRMNKVMKLILVLVSIGYIIIWFLLPTKIYKNKWTPTLEINLNSTYFQSQGINLLLFTFPVMLIAVCGCIYLHFQNKLQPTSATSTMRRGLSFWRRPVVVLSPLGIVTGVEIAFSAMFIALLIWSLSNYLYISFGHLHMHKQGEKVWQAKFRSISLRLGYIGNISWAFLFFPVTRGSPILGIFGLTSESSIKYHIWLGHISMVLFTAHSVGFVAYYAMTNQMVEMLEWSKTYVSNVAGEIAIVSAIVMWITSSYSIRRKKFELFFYTHHLYILYIIFYALHVGAAYFCMILPGISLFLVDRYLRFLQSMQNARLLSARLLPSGTLELNFSKDTRLYYNPTSIMYLNVPSISKLQWHPFTVTSNSEMEADVLTVVIKREGSWSHKLFNQISSSVEQLHMSVEGPYGPNSSHFLRHELLVMISGGSGITPFISIIRQIISQTTKPNTQIPRVILICAFKNSADLSMLNLLLPMNISPSYNFNQLNLQIEAYITRDQDQNQDQENPIETKWFKPNPKDRPITAQLGPNHWLWLGAIVASSFVMFLLLLGIVNRYYIYPIDKNTNEVYHYSYFVLWDLFLGCACVVIVCSLVIIWRKKQNDKASGQQIQNLEMETQIEQSELESLPRKSLVEATKVHFGARPDLKRILFECKGSDVGVLACGPRPMRHEVAKICSSGLANNLHFESISFNW